MFKKILFSVIFSVLAVNLYAATRLTTPYSLDVQQLNSDKENTLQENGNNLGMKQYKGKIKYKEPKPDVRLKDFRLYLGVGGRYTMPKTVTIEQSDEKTITGTYYNKKSEWDFDNNLNYFASIGLYWNNGVRIEFEYSEMTLDCDSFAKDFPNYESTSTVFNQYLQKDSQTLYHTSGGSLLYTTLTNNMQNVIELSVKTFMLNFIYEKQIYSAKIKPYIGFGVGVLKGDMNTLENDGASLVPGGQILAGLSYPISNNVAAIYLGYRGVFSKDFEQTFTRITGVDGYGGNYYTSDGTYYNPQFQQVKEKYNFQTQNIDLGIKFFF